MAVIETTSVVRGSVWAGFVARLDVLQARFEQYRAYRKTYVALNALSARELDDLGYGRADIERVAREAVGL